MKNTYLFLIPVLLFVFSCGKDDNPEPENSLPTVPSKIYPLNNTLCIDNAINFEWNASSDSDGDNIIYKVEVSENATFSNIIESQSVSNNTSVVITLEKGLSFFWRLKAIDSNDGESDFSEVSQFLTEGEGESNHLPFIPILVSPKLDSTISGTNTTLSWTANDADNDALTFDVYLDTNTKPITKVSENQTKTTYEAVNLNPETTYYFKIIVKDGKGGATVGQVWSFRTN